MIIAISGSVGVGKTTISKEISKLLNYEVIELNLIAEKFKLENVSELQTFDFDVEKCLNFIEKEYNKKDVILEGHFAHLLNPEFVDILIIINRDLKELFNEYKRRGYNELKIQQNLEVESLNVCFYEAEEEGYKENQFIVIDNSISNDIGNDLEDIVSELNYKIRRIKKQIKK